MFNYFWPVYKNIENEILNLTYKIHFSDKHLEVFSIQIAELLIRCVVEIESISKELYKSLGGDMEPTDEEGKIRYIKYDYDCLKLLHKKWNLGKKEVSIFAPSMYFENGCNITFKPLKNAHKGDQIWQRAYQSVKHYRTKEIMKGTLKSLIRAMGALYLMNVYYKDLNKVYSLGVDEGFETDLYRGRPLNFSRGSEIFKVRSLDISSTDIDYKSDEFQSATFIQVPWLGSYISNIKSLTFSGNKIGTKKVQQKSWLRQNDYWRDGEIIHNRTLTFRNSDGLVRYCEYSEINTPTLSWLLVGILNTNQRFDYLSFTDEENKDWLNRLEKELSDNKIYKKVQLVF